MPAFKVYMGASDLAGAVNRTLTVQLGSAMPVTEALLAEDLVSEDTYNAKDGDRVRIWFRDDDDGAPAVFSEPVHFETEVSYTVAVNSNNRLGLKMCGL